MQGGLPLTPADVLHTSTYTRRLKIHAVAKLARLFGFWHRPYKDAATSFEEMTLKDGCYWVYKCTDPIKRYEKYKISSNLLLARNSEVSLPLGFDKQASITFGAVGDLLRSEGLDQSKDILFENIAGLLFDRTISYANFESPITNQRLQKEVIGGGKPPIECCSRKQFDILKGHKGKNFTVLNTANNHMFDMGVEGIETTLETFASEGIADIGTNKIPEQHGQGKIIIRNGIKLGFVAATFGLNGHTMPPNEAYRIHTAKLHSKFSNPELSILKQQIDYCREQKCDFIIASLHWGYEFEFFPRHKQIEMAHIVIEWGADTIIGHHPHVIQPVEYYRTLRDSNRVAIIAYSLGSLVWGFTAPHLALSLVLNLTFSKGRIQDKEQTYVEQSSITPVFRSMIDNGRGSAMRIEKLEDHISGRKKLLPPRYIAAIKKYADMVLGKNSYLNKAPQPPQTAASLP